MRQKLLALLGSRKFLIAVIALAFAVRLLYCFVVFPQIGDALRWRGVDDGYDEFARNMLNGYGYVVSAGQPEDLMRPPGYAFLLYGVYGLLGQELTEGPRVWVLQSALDALTAWLIFLIGTSVLKSRAGGAIAALIWALYPQMAVYSARIAPEVVFTLMMVILFVVWLALERRRGAGWALLAGLVWALLALTKEKAILLPALLLLRLAWVRRASPGAFARDAALFCAAALIVLSPWLYRGYRLSGRFVPITLRGGRALTEGVEKELTARGDTTMLKWLEKGSFQKRARVPSPPMPEEKRREAMRETGEREASRLQKTLREITSSPGAFARKTASRLAAFWYWGQPRVLLANALVNLPLLALGLIGIARAWRTAPAAIALIFILYMNLIHALTVVRMRYCLPVMPFVILFAGVTLAHWLTRRGGRTADS